MPLTVVLPRNTSHISAAVRCGVAAGVKVTPKAGGHSYAALSLGGEDGHMVVEFEDMAAISVDPETNIATVQPGARLGNIATEIFKEGGRAFSHGTCPGVGIAGHALHGGYGMSSREHGLALDWIDSLTVVLANGTAVDCSASQHPDLFFAMLGAGSAFGITTEFRFRTFAAPETVTWFSASLPWNRTTAVAGLEALEEFTRDTMPKELNMRLSASRGSSSLEGVYYGDRAGLDEVLGPLLNVTGGKVARANTTGWIEGLEHYSEMGGRLTVPDPYDNHETFYSKSLELEGLNGTSAQNFVDYWFDDASDINRIWWFQVDLQGGASSGIWARDDGVTSYAHRDKLYIIQLYDRVFGGSYPKDGFEFLDGWVNTTTSPLEWGTWGMYVNYADARLERQDAEELYWGKNLPRLRDIKAELDPTEVFFNPVSIEPSSG
ncbi:hypothetical protein O988_06194 [Pseudogymnoascus sp. VKM F-3808]|nr:hypothetical protein O988_06194 [Pseudogymnoascus sp. VKM F-3808]